MKITDDRGGCWPTDLQQLLLKACLKDGNEAIEAWRKWDALFGLELLDRGSYRLLPLLYSNLSRLGLKHSTMARLKGIHRRSWCETRMLTHALAPVVQMLENAGIPTMLVKGAPLAFSFYRDPGLRPMDDIDILVPERRGLDALEVMQANGWQRKGKLWLGPEQMEFQNSVDLTGSQGRGVDLHWHLLHLACFAGADEAFWQGSVPFTFEGVPTRTLCATDHLLHACAHGLMWNYVPPVRWVADAAAVLSSATIDWDRLIKLSGQLRVALPVRDGLRYLSESLALPIPSEVVEALCRLKVSRTERRDYRRLQSPKLTGAREWWRLRYTVYARGSRGRSLGYKLGVVARWGILKMGVLLQSSRPELE